MHRMSIVPSLVPRPLPVSNVARKKREGLGREITCATWQVREKNGEKSIKYMYIC